MNSNKTTKIFLDGTLLLSVLNRHLESAMDETELSSEYPLEWDLSIKGEAHATTIQPIRVHLFEDGHVMISEGCPDFDSVHGHWVGSGFVGDSLVDLVKEALDQDELDETLYNSLLASTRELERLYA